MNAETSLPQISDAQNVAALRYPTAGPPPVGTISSKVSVISAQTHVLGTSRTLAKCCPKFIPPDF